MTYRPDIDGLRAIAILLVLIYHGGLTLFPSGFIGVDVFFVISGFLITQVITHSIEQNHFSFINFYNRRLWRLQPVFVTFLLITSLSTLLLFLPDDLMEYSRSARKASLFIANTFFNHTTTGYFSPDVTQLPLLHTWSLSIEWQCYFILPLGMYLLHKLFNKNQLLWVIAFLTVALLYYSLNSSQNIPAQNYYQFSSRLFEFLMGSLVAMIPLRSGNIPPILLNISGFIALGVIFYIARLHTILMGYPNGYAFLVCFATSFLIALGTFAPKQSITALLSLRPLVFLGLLSYSLYLWHWLVFSLLRYENIPETAWTLAVCYVGIITISYCSWRYIEKPTRQLNKIKFHYTVILLLFVPVIFTHLNSYFIKNNLGFPQRFNQELVTIYQQLQQYESKQRPLCISNAIQLEDQCFIGQKDGNKKGIMIGDSFSNHYWGLVDVLGKEANVSITAQGTSSCITLPGIYLYDWWTFKNQVYQECFEQTQKYYQMIHLNHYNYVLIGQAWENYLGNNIINKIGDKRSLKLSKYRLKDALDKGLKMITDSGATPILIKSTAQTKNNSHHCFYQHIKLHQSYDPKQCDFNWVKNKNDQWLDTLFNTMKTKYPHLVIIDPKDIQCTKGTCAAVLNGIPVYRDAGHITDYASYYIGKAYLQKYGNPLL